jgi:hypothetical protein
MSGAIDFSLDEIAEVLPKQQNGSLTPKRWFMLFS